MAIGKSDTFFGKYLMNKQAFQKFKSHFKVVQKSTYISIRYLMANLVYSVLINIQLQNTNTIEFVHQLKLGVNWEHFKQCQTQPILLQCNSQIPTSVRDLTLESSCHVRYEDLYQTHLLNSRVKWTHLDFLKIKKYIYYPIIQVSSSDIVKNVRK